MEDLNPSQAAEIEVIEKEGWQMVRPTGSITTSTANKFIKTLFQLKNLKKRKIMFDMRGVDEVDNIGVSMFFSFGKNFKSGRLERRLQIINLKRPLLNTFLLKGMFRFYTIAP